MKNLLKVFLMATVLVATIGFSSCSKKSMVGTSWTYNSIGVAATMNFVDATTVTWSTVIVGQSPTVGTYTYTYSDPNISITYEDGVVNGTVSGNTMTLTDNGVTMIFTKN